MRAPARSPFAALLVLLLLVLAPAAQGAWPTFRGSDARTGLAAGEAGHIRDVGARWSATALQPVVSSPAVVDVAGDARPEVVFSEWGGRCLLYTSDAADE